MRSRPGTFAGLVLFLLVLFPLRTEAHHRPSTSGGPLSGIAIDNLTHGQMEVIADNAPGILNLAGQQTRTDPTFRRLMNFALLQRTYCLWSLVPGSLRDEESPFNECTHAYLATLRELLLHMAEMPDGAIASRPLIEKIEREMIAREASLTLCRYSGEEFNTAEVIMPRWRDIPFHPPSLLVFGGAACALAAAAIMFFQRKPPRPV